MSTLKTTFIQHPSAEGPAIELDATDGVVFTAASFDAAAITSGVLDAARVPLPAGIGSNVVQTVKTDTFTTSSTSFTDVTGLAVTITPSSATAKVLILSYFTLSLPLNVAASLRLMRNSTAIFVGDAEGARPSVTALLRSQVENFMSFGWSPIVVDSPNSAAAVTYKYQIQSNGNAHIGRTDANPNSADGARTSASIIAIEVAP